MRQCRTALASCPAPSCPPPPPTTVTAPWVFARDFSVGVAVGPDGVISASVAAELPGGARSNYTLGAGTAKTTLLPSYLVAPSACTARGAGTVAAGTQGLTLSQTWACTVRPLSATAGTSGSALPRCTPHQRSLA